MRTIGSALALLLISNARPYAELRRSYEQASDDATRGRILDAMAQGNQREGLPLARDVIAKAKALDAIPAAIRFVVAMKDSSAVAGIVALYPVLPADRRMQVIKAINALAGPGHLDLVKPLLIRATPAELHELTVGYFHEHPVPELLVALRWQVGPQYAQHWNLALDLAALGDEDVLRWALSHLDDPALQHGQVVRLEWFPYYVIGRSPLPRAREAADRFLAGGGNRARWIRASRHK